VNSLVVASRRELRETVCTVLAFVPFYGLVDVHVVQQSVLGREVFTALIAQERPFAAVVALFLVLLHPLGIHSLVCTLITVENNCLDADEEAIKWTTGRLTVFGVLMDVIFLVQFLVDQNGFHRH